MVLILYKDDIVTKGFLKTIKNIAKTTPGLWIIASNIIKNPKYTCIIDTTLIINVYELSEKKLIILYKVLKILKKSGGILKVLNKKEFLIVHFYNSETIKLCVNNHLWKLLEIEEIIKQQYNITNVEFKKDKLSFKINNIIYYFYINSENNIIYYLENDGLERVLTYTYKRSLFESRILEILSKKKK